MELKGTVASKPEEIISGIACNFEESPHSFVEGYILITEQTYPDMLPLIKKSVAIVTETGGILSHAAIVSRELKIPCIVNVKNITKIVHTGDKITLDLRTGTIIKH